MRNVFELLHYLVIIHELNEQKEGGHALHVIVGELTALHREDRNLIP